MNANNSKNPIRVPTKTSSAETAPRAELDVSEGLSSDDLSTLRKTDPFMYYSIPGVRTAAIFGRSVERYDTNALMGNGEQLGLARRSSMPGLNTRSAAPATTPAQSHNQRSRRATVSSEQRITRRSSISYEVHPDLLLGDLMEESANEESVSSGNSFEDLLQKTMG